MKDCLPRSPKHIAIIMDGNGRWAEHRGHARLFGHVKGASRVRAIVEEAGKMGVKALTLYAFSTENWGRPELERKVLWRLFQRYLLSEVEHLAKNNVKIAFIGQIDRVPSTLKTLITSVTDRLSSNTGLRLNVAISYGSRIELIEAAKSFAEDCLEGKKKVSNLTETDFSEYLSTSHLGEFSDVDLLIRTGGDQRMSNFLLWQAAYAECVFMDVYWPDFLPGHLREAIEEFNGRERRFGKVIPKVAQERGGVLL